MDNNTNVKIFVSGRVVGNVSNGIFSKRIKTAHMLHTPPAIALSAESLAQAIDAGAHSISITNIETGRVYTCDIAHFKHYAFDLQRRDYESQKALPLERWDVTYTDTHPAPHNETVTESEHTHAAQMTFSGAGWGKVYHE
jgi:hypothetical protein